MSRMGDADFHAPPWDAPLDVAAEIERIPPAATIKGLFLIPLVAEMRKKAADAKSPRDRYLPFSDYPLREHAHLLADAAHLLYPDLTTRRGLRKLGRAAQRAFAETTLGKVVWSTVYSVDTALDAAAKTYAIVTPSVRITVMERATGRALVRLEGPSCFFDSNQVGTFEGVLRTCDVRPVVAIRTPARDVGELLLTWTAPSVRPGR
jgi:uncharacterized protein (TIGR02265 family)